jgi:hypothetical protein
MDFHMEKLGAINHYKGLKLAEDLCINEM